MLGRSGMCGLAEVETVRGNKVFCAKPGLRDVFPRKAEQLAAPRMHLAMKQRKAASVELPAGSKSQFHIGVCDCGQ